MTSADFTDAGFRELVVIAKTRHVFRPFADALTMSDGLLWRHDIDMSVHRALALARIERDEQVAGAFFVYLHSTFYNALEADIVALLLEIVSLGHEIGLHFDPLFYGLRPSDTEALERAVAAERDLLQGTLRTTVAAVSFHNPDVSGFKDEVHDDRIAGLVNAYGNRLRRDFAYCSDSSGYWRSKPIRDVLTEPGRDRIQVLTHPEWWVPEPMPPRSRVARAINGRSASVARRYNEALRALGRETDS